MKNLFGENIMLREYREEDIDHIYTWNHDKNTTRWMGRRFRDPRSFEEIHSSVRRHISDPPKDGVFFVIADKSSEAYLGGIDLTSIDVIDRNAVLSIVVAKERDRNKGMGAEAIKLLAAFAFGKLHLHKIELGVEADNAAAVRCYQKIGFKIEGTIRDHTFIDDTFHDLLKMGLLESELSP